MNQEEAYDALTGHLDRVAPRVQDRLPSERALANALGCSRSTLRAALDRLEQEGEIWRHVGQGTFRGARPRHLPVRDRLLIEGATPRDLMQARLVLEPAVAAAAADRATAQDIAHLSARVQAGRKGRDRAACEQADDAFHQSVAVVADNPILIGLMRYLSGARRRATWQQQWEQAYRRLGVEEFRRDHSDQHQAIVDAIAQHDAPGASDAMRHHLMVINDALGRG